MRASSLRVNLGELTISATCAAPLSSTRASRRWA